MANTDQGYYKKLRKSISRVLREGEDLIDAIYDDDRVLKGDFESLWDRLNDLNNCYEAAKKIKVEVENMLESQEFKMDEKKAEYESFIFDLENLKDTLHSTFNEIKRSIGNTGFTDSESATLSNYSL